MELADLVELCCQRKAKHRKVTAAEAIARLTGVAPAQVRARMAVGV